MIVEFQNIENHEIDQAYLVLMNRIDDLIKIESGQYTHYHPGKETYITRNVRKENWCLCNDDKIIGIVSLSKNYIPYEWNKTIKSDSFYWLSSLFVDLKEKGNNYGRKILEKCVKTGISNGIKEIYLDCYMDSEFLVKYYENKGFTKIAEQEFDFGTRKFRAALMNLQI